MRGRRTEIDELNGFVAREGRRLGVKTPFNEAVVERSTRTASARSSPIRRTSSR